MLTDFAPRLQRYLNQDEELARRLKGFRTFAGAVDDHYQRAREQGMSAAARAVRCYPFGGESQLKDNDWIRIRCTDGPQSETLVISWVEKQFRVSFDEGKKPYLSVVLPKQLLIETLLGKHRWVWLFALDEVEVQHADNLPHSDWVTLLEVLVTLQEVVEFDSGLWKKVEQHMPQPERV